MALWHSVRDVEQKRASSRAERSEVGKAPLRWALVAELALLLSEQPVGEEDPVSEKWPVLLGAVWGRLLLSTVGLPPVDSGSGGSMWVSLERAILPQMALWHSVRDVEQKRASSRAERSEVGKAPLRWALLAELALLLSAQPVEEEDPVSEVWPVLLGGVWGRLLMSTVGLPPVDSGSGRSMWVSLERAILRSMALRYSRVVEQKRPVLRAERSEVGKALLR